MPVTHAATPSDRGPDLPCRPVGHASDSGPYAQPNAGGPSARSRCPTPFGDATLLALRQMTNLVLRWDPVGRALGEFDPHQARLVELDESGPFHRDVAEMPDDADQHAGVGHEHDRPVADPLEQRYQPRRTLSSRSAHVSLRSSSSRGPSASSRLRIDPNSSAVPLESPWTSPASHHSTTPAWRSTRPRRESPRQTPRSDRPGGHATRAADRRRTPPPGGRRRLSPAPGRPRSAGSAPTPVSGRSAFTRSRRVARGGSRPLTGTFRPSDC